MKSRAFLWMIFPALLLISLFGATCAAAERPNILFIMTDQQSATMMSCTGNPYLSTPALDRLAATGVRFERAYCGNPVCIPSRFSMLSGRLPSRIGIDRNARAEVSPEILTDAMGNVFRRAGYETVYGGKTHLPNAKDGIESYGFTAYLEEDERGTLAETCAAYLAEPHDKPFLLVASFINPHDICYMAIDAHSKAVGQPPRYPHSVVERQRLARALRLPEDVSRETFFQELCPPLPENFEVPEHEPSAVRGSDWRSFRAYAEEQWTEEEWRLHRWAYCKLTEEVDRQIGVVLDALDETGLADTTLVIFTSDHGDMDAAHRLEHKSMPYEEATRVPFLVRLPNVTAAGRVDGEHLVSTGLDLIPTMCDFSGIAKPEALPGVSVKPLTLPEPTDAGWRETLVAENERSRVLWSGRFKYAVYDQGEPQEMLIDLESDPGEMENLAVLDRYAPVLRTCRAALASWYAEHADTLPEEFVVSEE